MANRFGKSNWTDHDRLRLLRIYQNSRSDWVKCAREMMQECKVPAGYFTPTNCQSEIDKILEQPTPRIAPPNPNTCYSHKIVISNWIEELEERVRQQEARAVELELVEQRRQIKQLERVFSQYCNKKERDIIYQEAKRKMTSFESDPVFQKIHGAMMLKMREMKTNNIPFDVSNLEDIPPTKPPMDEGDAGTKGYLTPPRPYTDEDLVEPLLTFTHGFSSVLPVPVSGEPRSEENAMPEDFLEPPSPTPPPVREKQSTKEKKKDKKKESIKNEEPPKREEANGGLEESEAKNTETEEAGSSSSLPVRGRGRSEDKEAKAADKRKKDEELSDGKEERKAEKRKKASEEKTESDETEDATIDQKRKKTGEERKKSEERRGTSEELSEEKQPRKSDKTRRRNGGAKQKSEERDVEKVADSRQKKERKPEERKEIEKSTSADENEKYVKPETSNNTDEIGIEKNKVIKNEQVVDENIKREEKMEVEEEEEEEEEVANASVAPPRTRSKPSRQTDKSAIVPNSAPKSKEMSPTNDDQEMKTEEKPSTPAKKNSVKEAPSKKGLANDDELPAKTSAARGAQAKELPKKSVSKNESTLEESAIKEEDDADSYDALTPRGRGRPRASRDVVSENSASPEPETPATPASVSSASRRSHGSKSNCDQEERSRTPSVARDPSESVDQSRSSSTEMEAEGGTTQECQTVITIRKKAGELPLVQRRRSKVPPKDEQMEEDKPESAPAPVPVGPPTFASIGLQTSAPTFFGDNDLMIVRIDELRDQFQDPIEEEEEREPPVLDDEICNEIDIEKITAEKERKAARKGKKGPRLHEPVDEQLRRRELPLIIETAEPIAQRLITEKAYREVSPSSDEVSRDTSTKRRRDERSREEICALKLQLLTMHRDIFENVNADPFKRPVPASEVDYSRVVKAKVDLSMIKREIENDTIGSIETFLARNYRMCCNAIMFNGAEHDVHKLAEALLKHISELPIDPSEMDTGPIGTRRTAGNPRQSSTTRGGISSSVGPSSSNAPSPSPSADTRRNSSKKSSNAKKGGKKGSRK